MVVGDQRTGHRRACGPVVPDRRGQRQDALGDTHRTTQRRPAAVQLQIKLPFERVVDRLGKLPDRFETYIG